METTKYKNEYDLDVYFNKYLTNSNKYLIVIHGSIEHIGRYKDFCENMSKNGINCYAMDLVGHGRSSNGKLGYFSSKKNGYEIIYSDIDYLYNLILKENKDAEISIFGHSMGSFIVRDYLKNSNNLFESAVISGTMETPFLTSLLCLFIRTFMKIKGSDFRSFFVHRLMYGRLSKRKEKNKFLTTEKKEREKYAKDPLCNFIVTLDYVNEMLKCLSNIKKCETKNKNKMLFVSGKLDPLAKKDGSAVIKIAKRYKKHNEVYTKIYEGMYHEVLNEKNKVETYNDILNFLK